MNNRSVEFLAKAPFSEKYIKTKSILRIIPNVHEVVFSFYGATLEEQPWPLWLDMISIISHLALTISCSLSFYIYFGNYGLKRRLARMRFQLQPLTRAQQVPGNLGDLILPDMDNLGDNETSVENLLDSKLVDAEIQDGKNIYN